MRSQRRAFAREKQRVTRDCPLIASAATHALVCGVDAGRMLTGQLDYTSRPLDVALQQDGLAGSASGGLALKDLTRNGNIEVESDQAVNRIQGTSGYRRRRRYRSERAEITIAAGRRLRSIPATRQTRWRPLGD